MNWKNNEIKNHEVAAKRLSRIKDRTILYISENKNITEHEVERFIRKQINKQGMTTDRPQIVAFRQNTSSVHYYPAENSKKIKPESLIMIDIWARLKEKDSPFADVTFMAYYGKKISPEIKKVFNIVVEARDKTMEFIKSELKKGVIPTGKDADSIARSIIAKKGYGDKFPHTTGHPLGFSNPHGRGTRLGPKGKINLKKMTGYTIEPGIYLKNKFGIRSEIDFYIDERMKMVITSEVQRKIIII